MITTVRLSRPQFALLCALAPSGVFGLQELHYGFGGITLEVVDPVKVQQTCHALQEGLPPNDRCARGLLAKLDNRRPVSAY